MTPDKTSGRRDDADRSEATTADQDNRAAHTVDQPADRDAELRRGLARDAETRHTVLALQQPPEEIGRTLATFVDAVLRPESQTAELLGHLAQQLLDAGVLAQQLEAYAVERQQDDLRALTQGFERALRQTIHKATRSADRWFHHTFINEWTLYRNEDGREYPLPRGWHERVERLAYDGMPWGLAQIQIHATLTGSGPRNLDAFIRSSRRTLRKLHSYAEHTAAAELPGLRLIRGGRASQASAPSRESDGR